MHQSAKGKQQKAHSPNIRIHITALFPFSLTLLSTLGVYLENLFRPTLGESVRDKNRVYGDNNPLYRVVKRLKEGSLWQQLY